MLRITVELIPYGEESLKRTLDIMTIYNDGTSTDGNVGNYKARTSFEGDLFVKDHTRSDGYWELIKKVISKLKWEY